MVVAFSFKIKFYCSISLNKDKNLQKNVAVEGQLIQDNATSAWNGL